METACNLSTGVCVMFQNALNNSDLHGHDIHERTIGEKVQVNFRLQLLFIYLVGL